jgi:uncharacterized membrane protein
LRRIRISPAAGVVAAAMAVYVMVFGYLTWRQQSNFAQFGFDLGIYDQSLWLMSKFYVPFNTIRGLNYFGHHVNLITVVFVPFYWLGAGPHFLLLVQTVALAAGAIPIYLLGCDLLAEPAAAAVIAIAYLLHPTVEWINWWNFHPDALMILPLLCCWLLARRGRWGWFAVSAAVALACKEDAALAVVVMAVLAAVLFRRRSALIVAAAGAAWFVVATRVIIPHANGGIGPFYNDMFPTLGTNGSSIAKNAVLHPSRIGKPLTQVDRLAYFARILAPVGFVAVLALPVLLIAAPQTVINSLSDQGYTFNAHFHYSAIFIVAVFLACIEACAYWGRNRAVQGALCGVVIAAALVTNVVWSPSPAGRSFHSGIWAASTPRTALVSDAVGLIPAGAGVTGSYDVVTHLTHRARVFEYPNPWIVRNWGIHGERPANTASVDWIVLDEPIDGGDLRLFRYLTDQSHEFEIVLNRAGVVVARRTAPPTIQQVKPPA